MRLFFAVLLILVGSPIATAGSVHRIHSTDITTLLNGEDLRSTAGRPIKVLRLEPADGLIKWRFLVQGGLHGDEKLGPEFVRWLANHFATSIPIKMNGIAIDFIPESNPDGVHLNQRGNSNGINLNRNFAVGWGISRENPGPKPFSENETQALKRLIETQNYTATIDIHGYVNWIVLPSKPRQVIQTGRQVSSDLARLYRVWTKAIESQMSIFRNYKTKTALGLGDGGSFEDWTFYEAGTLSFCLELESDKRFRKLYRTPFGNLAQLSQRPIDTFLSYERFVVTMMRQAIRIDESKLTGTGHLLADQKR